MKTQAADLRWLSGWVWAGGVVGGERYHEEAGSVVEWLPNFIFMT